MTFEQAFREAGAVANKLRSNPNQFNYSGCPVYGEVMLMCTLDRFPFMKTFSYNKLQANYKDYKAIEEAIKNSGEEANELEWSVYFTVTKEHRIDTPTLEQDGELHLNLD